MSPLPTSPNERKKKPPLSLSQDAQKKGKSQKSSSPPQKGNPSHSSSQPPKKVDRTDSRWKNYYTKLYPRDAKGHPKKLSKADEIAFRERIDRLVSAPRQDPKNPMKNFDSFLTIMREAKKKS